MTDFHAPRQWRVLGQPSTPSAAAPVLVVDDNAAKRLAITAILSPLGHRIVEADSGLAALRHVMEEDFAVILLDVRMPDMDGFETAAHIRERVQSEITPIIFTTAFKRQDLETADLYGQGAVDFMDAPFSPIELRAKVTVFANIFLKAQRLAERAQEVSAAGEHLRLLMDAAPIGIFQTDAAGRYVYTNPRWTAITGIAANDAFGRDWYAMIGPALRNDEAHDDSKSVREDRFEIVHPDAARHVVQMTSQRILDSGASLAGWVGTLADVTAEAGAEEAMATAWAEAIRTNQNQLDFVESASHELRTPTASVLGCLEIVLEDEALPEEVRTFLEIANRNAVRLTELIDDLLVLGRSEIREQDMHLAPTAMVPLVERVVADFSATALAGDITLAVDHEPETPFAMIDASRLEQALTNILGNALKFTEAGGSVHVKISSDERHVKLEVIDTGIGIAPADLERVFERFYRVRDGEAAVKGSGLGLAIAKGMIESQNGRITMTSSVGVGTTFTIVLPVVDSAAAAPPLGIELVGPLGELP